MMPVCVLRGRRRDVTGMVAEGDSIAPLLLLLLLPWTLQSTTRTVAAQRTLMVPSVLLLGQTSEAGPPRRRQWQRQQWSSLCLSTRRPLSADGRARCRGRGLLCCSVAPLRSAARSLTRPVPVHRSDAGTDQRPRRERGVAD